MNMFSDYAKTARGNVISPSDNAQNSTSQILFSGIFRGIEVNIFVFGVRQKAKMYAMSLSRTRIETAAV